MTLVATLSDADVHALVTARDAAFYAWRMRVMWGRDVDEARFFDTVPIGADRAAALERYRRGRALLEWYRVIVVCGPDPRALLAAHVHASGADLLGYRVELDGVDERGRQVYALFLVHHRPAHLRPVSFEP